MKTQVAFIALVLLCMNQVYCQFNLNDYFGPGAQSVLSGADFGALAHSKSLKISLNKLLYKAGDTDFDGYLSLAEFTPVWARFIQAIGGQTPDQELTEEAFGFADHIVKDGQLSYSEFAWLIGSQLGFLGNNANLLSNNQVMMKGAAATELPDLSKIFDNPVFKFLFDAFLKPFEKITITLEKFKEILKFIADFFKINLDWSDCVLNGFLDLADANGDGKVSLKELKDFLKFMFKNLNSILSLV